MLTIHLLYPRTRIVVISPVLDDLFSDDDDDKVETSPAVETTTIENPLTTSSGVEIPQVSSSKPAPSSLGIEIPDFDTDSTSVTRRRHCEVGIAQFFDDTSDL